MPRAVSSIKEAGARGQKAGIFQYPILKGYKTNVDG